MRSQYLQVIIIVGWKSWHSELLLCSPNDNDLVFFFYSLLENIRNYVCEMRWQLYATSVNSLVSYGDKVRYNNLVLHMLLTVEYFFVFVMSSDFKREQRRTLQNQSEKRWLIVEFMLVSFILIPSNFRYIVCVCLSSLVLLFECQCSKFVLIFHAPCLSVCCFGMSEAYILLIKSDLFAVKS